MSEFVRCKVCNGTSKFSPLGFILKDCQACDGIGYLEYKPAISAPNAPKVDQKKRGRPKKKHDIV